MTMYGADVAALRSLAAQLDRAADELDEHRAFLSNAVHQSPWLGPDADRFRGQWDGEHNTRVATSARLLRDTAATVRRNADDQERVSAVDGGTARSSFPASKENLQGERIANGVEASLFSMDVAEALKKVAPFSNDAVKTLAGLLGTDSEKVMAKIEELKIPNSIEGFSKALGVLGVADDAVTMVRDFASGNVIDGALGTAVTGTSAAAVAGGFGLGSAALATAWPLELAATALKGFVDITLPVNAERQDETYRMGAESLFGPDIDPNDLTPAQAQTMVDHYSGPIGVVNMISDTMDASAKRIFPWNW
ncbi:WXG100 family type VII secretion target [Pseudarthrobacter sp. NPDC058196]|uniref:WXG100 family type VII secretion target n=1 Tax=Pseudarthrobacter sp. NPDC058196 TaxID=3346376 RepID=UPI0036D87DAE